MNEYEEREKDKRKGERERKGNRERGGRGRKRRREGRREGRGKDTRMTISPFYKKTIEVISSIRVPHNDGFQWLKTL